MSIIEHEELIKRVTARIEAQNWTDKPLTEDEKGLIAMAVSSTVADLRGPGPEKPTSG